MAYFPIYARSLSGVEMFILWIAAIVISEIAKLREKERKNQQSRVERPITDRFVSWNCNGFHPRNRRLKGLTRARAAEALRKQMERSRDPLLYKNCQSRSLVTHRPYYTPNIRHLQDDLLDVYPTTTETPSSQATVIITRCSGNDTLRGG